MARLELYLFFVFLMQEFNFEAVSGSENVDLSGDLGLVVEPRPIKVKVQSRKR